MPDDTQFTRRICAVLLADVTGFSALMGRDDERTARAVHRLQQVVQDLVAEAGGRAEPCAGDAIFATFDSVVGAVGAALDILRHLDREQFEGQHLKLRMGIHVGDVLTRGGAAFGDAINIAARLQTLARPGSICVSETVYRQVRNRFDDRFVSIGRQHLKNISDHMQAYLILPRDVAVGHNEPPYRRVLRWAAVAVAAAVALAAVVGLVLLDRGRVAVPVPGVPPAPVSERAGHTARLRSTGSLEPAAAGAEKVVLGVMGFKSLGGGEGDDWRREALRDGLNTQLSQLSQVRVYSKEFIDFLISRKGLSEIEAAKDLGIAKMVSGSFVVVRDELKVETHVVDVDTGVIEASYETAGQAHEFLALQNQLALGLIARLDIPISDAERRLLAQRPSNEDALRMLLEAEGETGVSPTPPARKGAHLGAPTGWLASALAAAPSLAPRRAYADDTAQAAILAALERYRGAMEARDLARLGALYQEFPPEQQAAQQRYFDNVRDLKVTIENPEIAVVGDEAVVSYTRTDDFVDARTGRPMHVSVRLTKILVRDDGNWRLAPGK